MAWKDAMKDFGGGDLTFLSEDGEVCQFVVAAEPALIAGKFKGKETERGGVPIFTLDGQTLLVVGKRVIRRLYKHEKQFETHAFQLVRNGEPNDTNTTYSLTVIDNKELTDELLKIKSGGIDKTELAESYKSALEAAKG